MNSEIKAPSLTENQVAFLQECLSDKLTPLGRDSAQQSLIFLGLLERRVHNGSHFLVVTAAGRAALEGILPAAVVLAPDPTDFTVKELRKVVERLIEGFPGVRTRARDGLDVDLELFLTGGMGGWSIPNILRTAAACALVKQLPRDHPDVVFVVGALGKYGYR